jgi:tetratricopeptide (TPR) repeat protein
MNHRPLISLLLLASHTARAGQDARMRLGDEALNSGLWEIAARHYDACLGAPGLDAATKSEVAIRLAESWLRDGKTAEALELLDQSFAASHPEAPFWKGQTLATLGRINEALDLLLPLLADRSFRWRIEAALTVRNLQLALGKPDEALETLKSFSTGDGEIIPNALKLAEVEILLELARTADARQSLSELAEPTAHENIRALFLDGRILLAEGKSTEAVEVFRKLIAQPQAQSPHMHHQAALALADALVAVDDRDGATSHLLEFIRSHTDSTYLGELFQRLRNAMPDTIGVADPLLEALAQWITPPELATAGMIADVDCSAVSAWPSAATADELVAHALYSRATAMMRVKSSDAANEARRQLMRLRLEFPNHPLASRALFDLARMAHAEGKHEATSDMLAALRESADPPSLRGEAAFLEAMNAWRDGGSEDAAALFEEAAASLDENDARTARFNAALLHLIQNDGTAAAPAGDPALTSDLELERALTLVKPADRRTAIEELLLKHPAHPRMAEARLSAAEAALASTPPDFSFARAQLDTLAADPEKSAALSAPRVAMLGLRIADMSGDAAAAIAAARVMLEKFPGDPAAAEASLVLGRNLFQTGSYNEARMVLEKLAATDADAARAEAAWLLAARSAALIPASQSQDEALVLFDKVIAAKGPLAALARLEKVRLMIDMNRLAEAAANLREWIATLDAADPLRLPAGLLLGEAVYGQGGTHAASLVEALEVYDGLLAGVTPENATFNRLQYLRGRTLEQIPDANDPSRKRDKEAFTAYYSVLEIDGAPAEWHYFELCGFRALALLEKAGRWPAAVACARKIASFKGPRAEEAEARASQLQLKHMLWEE